MPPVIRTTRTSPFRLATLCLPVLALAVLAAPQAAFANEAVYRKALPSTVWVLSRKPNAPGDGLSVNGEEWNYQGAGVLVDRRRRIVATNFHVVEGNQRVLVSFPRFDKQGQPIVSREQYVDPHSAAVVGHVVEQDPKRDLALVQLESLPDGAGEIVMADRDPNIGQTVHAIGNSDPHALWTYRTGRVRTVLRVAGRMDEGFEIDVRLVKTTSAANSGDSGGPVLNDLGELVAITQALGPQSLVTHSVAVSELKSLLEGDNTSIDRRVGKALEQAGMTFQIDAFGVHQVNVEVDGGKLAAYIASVTQKSSEKETRRMWVSAHHAPAPLTQELTDALLRVNGTLSFGAWRTWRRGGEHHVVLSAEVDAALPADQLVKALSKLTAAAANLKRLLADGTPDDIYQRLTGEKARLSAARSPFWPLLVGTRWEYKATSGGKSAMVEFKVAAEKEIAGVVAARLELSVHGRVMLTQHAVARKEGVFLYAEHGRPLAPPRLFFKAGAKQGDSWVWETDGGEKITYRVVAVNAKVMVPAGAFETIAVEKRDAGGKVVVQYFAQGVGMVKRTEPGTTFELTKTARSLPELAVSHAN